MIGLIHAFWNAVPRKRGGSQPSSSSAGLTKTTPKPKPQWTSAGAFASCSLRTAWPMSCAVWGIDSSATMRMPFWRQASLKLVR